MATQRCGYEAQAVDVSEAQGTFLTSLFIAAQPSGIPPTDVGEVLSPERPLAQLCPAAAHFDFSLLRCSQNRSFTSYTMSQQRRMISLLNANALGQSASSRLL